MSNFHVSFSHPWLLLLIIPALALTLWPYLRITKKYRRTRNRVVSIVLHVLIMSLCISVLAGISFNYQVSNSENEVLLLVDVSFSGKDTESEKNAFVREVIEENTDNFKLGVVTFGFGQVYAVELTDKTDNIYNRYLNARLPDTSATDIASALEYASSLFKHPSSAKIILISDGIQTDDDANSVIRSIAADGIRVDTVYFPAQLADKEVQIIEAERPDYNIHVGDPFTFKLTVQSSYIGGAKITLYDNEEPSGVFDAEFTIGTQTVEIEHTFTVPDMHEIYFELEGTGDTLTQNNTYYSYINLEVFDKILVIEHADGESEKLCELLESYDVQPVKASELTEFLFWDNSDAANNQFAVDALRQYDQVILLNISNADMPEHFDEVLSNYVYVHGGGLFTVGGNQTDGSGNVLLDSNGNPIANAYNRADMHETLFEQMLPVQTINYTPPLGVMIIIDRSGSMNDTVEATGETKLDLAKKGAASCLYALSERDWVGVVTLESSYSEDAELTPVPQQAKILSVIDKIEIGGATVFTGAIEAAGRALTALRGVERRHMILVTDGQPGDAFEEYGERIKHYYDTAGITLSIVSIGGDDYYSETMRAAAEDLGHGRYYDVWDVTTLPGTMREELNTPEIKEVHFDEEGFTPAISSYTSVMNGIKQEEMPKLFGYYGTKAKEDAQVLLSGEYVPIYAQRRYGAGIVGSFMCDLSGYWSAEFMNSPTGIRLLGNIVNSLFPTENIHPKEIEFDFTEDNYTTQVNIYTALNQGEHYEITLTSPPENYWSEPTVQTVVLDGTRQSFTINRAGIYTIQIRKKDNFGRELASCTAYKAFSYSQEYNAFLDEQEGKALLESIAKRGNGALITQSYEAYGGLVKTLDRTFDPRLAFSITAIVLFLLDIAVRKFKFKWPHELIRDYKTKKAMRSR